MQSYRQIRITNVFSKKLGILITLQLLASIIFAREIHISGNLPPVLSPTQILYYEYPFDKHTTVLAELTPAVNGNFEMSLNIEQETIILFQSGNITNQLLMKPGHRYIINFNDQLGISSLTSDDPMTELIIGLEKDIAALKAENKMAEKYAKKLVQYFDDLFIAHSANNEIQIALTNSLAFAKAMKYLRHFGTTEQYAVLEQQFLRYFDYSYSELRLVNTFYRPKIPFYRLLNPENNRLEFVTLMESSLTEISNPKLKLTVKLAIINEQFGGRMEATKSVEMLDQFIAQCDVPALSSYARNIRKEQYIIGNNLSNIDLKNLKNKPISFQDYQGKYLLLNFWATRCRSCDEAIQKLQALHDELSDKLNILSIFNEKDIEKIKNFVNLNAYAKKMEYAYPTDRSVIKNYFIIKDNPMYFLIDPHGVIVGRTYNDYTSLIEKHVK